jgi:hypothetical protein
MEPMSPAQVVPPRPAGEEASEAQRVAPEELRADDEAVCRWEDDGGFVGQVPAEI